jgi:hypothetical protein
VIGDTSSTNTSSAKIRRKMGTPTTDVPFFSAGCKARITLNENNDLVSPTPDHNHETQVAETHVHVVKQDLKRKVPTSDLPTKYLVAGDCRPLFDHTK